MMRLSSLLILSSLLALAEGQSSPSVATPSIATPSIFGGFGDTFPPYANACLDDANAFLKCISDNLPECFASCASVGDTGADTGDACSDIQSACPTFTCCASCSELGKAVASCTASANSCTGVSCGDFTPTVPSPSVVTSPFSLPFPPNLPSLIGTFPPNLPSLIGTFPPNLPSILEGDFCVTETFAWQGCRITNAESCTSTCGDVGSTLYDDCDSFTTVYCPMMTCCDACANEGRAYAACLSDLYECTTDCGSFSPLAPTTVDFPSILTSMMPMMGMPSTPIDMLPTILAPFSLPPNLPSILEGNICVGETFVALATCFTTNDESCASGCDGVDGDTDLDIPGCEFISAACPALTCCDACANEGRAYAACLSDLYECTTDCGSFSPLAPTTADFPSILTSMMPMMGPTLPPSSTPPSATGIPVTVSPTPPDTTTTTAPVSTDNTTAPVPTNTTTAPVPTDTTTAPVSTDTTTAPVPTDTTTAPVSTDTTSAPTMAATTKNGTMAPTLRTNGTLAPTRASGSVSASSSTALTAILTGVFGFAALCRSLV